MDEEMMEIMRERSMQRSNEGMQRSGGGMQRPGGGGRGGGGGGGGAFGVDVSKIKRDAFKRTHSFATPMQKIFWVLAVILVFRAFGGGVDVGSAQHALSASLNFQQTGIDPLTSIMRIVSGLMQFKLVFFIAGALLFGYIREKTKA